MAKITIYGTGYVGLVTGVCLAELGHEVFCVDIDEDKIKKLQGGTPTIEEKDLPALLQKNQQEGRIVFTSNLKEAFQHGFYHIVAVGTPEGKNGEADLTFVKAVSSAIMAARDEAFVIVNKSTVPVGTADKMRDLLLKEQTAQGKTVAFDVISNPEFLREGAAVHDCLHPDRIVLGGTPEVVEKAVEDLYGGFMQQHIPILKMDACSAELTKYAANAMLATKISLMNELSFLAEKTGADIEVVRQGMAADPRIGPHYIAPGCGYGGSCFPKDVKALLAMSRQYDLPASLLKAVDDVNKLQTAQFIQKIRQYLEAEDGDSIAGKTVALWGVAFKPETDDVRESSAIYIADGLRKVGVKVRAYDPAAMKSLHNVSGIEAASSPYQAVKDADALIIATDWPEFKTVNLQEIYTALKIPAIFDGRNIFALTDMQALPFDYFSVGRPAVLNREKKQ